MKWTKYELSTTTEAVDFVSDMLGEFGIEGIEIEDNIPLSEEEKKRMFVDILPQLEPDDGKAIVSFYLEIGQEEKEKIIEQVKERLIELSKFVDIGAGTIASSETEDKDWLNNWKEFFKPFRVDDTIVIKPTWEKLENQKPEDLVIEIDPGISFGTGSHETTKLGICGLKKYVFSGCAILDLGCGSGILSIVGEKLGAGFICAVDIDPDAVRATGENLAVNHIPEKKVKALCGNILEDVILQQEVKGEKYDIVVANILADVIIPLSSLVSSYLKQEGVFISSGIIKERKEDVKKAMIANGLKIAEIREMGDWVSIIARK